MAWFEWGGDRNYGYTTVPQDVGNSNHVVRVSAALVNLLEGGVYHFRLVASNSVGVTPGFDSMFTTGMKVQHWGSFSDGVPVVPPGLTNLSGIASGHGHCIGIRNDGTVAAWLVTRSLPYATNGQTDIPPGLSNVIAVAGGFSHCLALKEDSTVVAWGKYDDGTPADVPPNLTNVIAIGGGDYFSAALKADGTIVEWGKNAFYPGTTNVPYGLTDVIAISCGTGHTLALKANGTVVVWGGDAGAISAPASATNVVAVATMGIWNLALRADGSVVNWGSSFYPDVPKPADLTNAVAIATGYGYGEVLLEDGRIQGWGRAQDATNIPHGLSNVVMFASGDYHRVGLAPVNLPPQLVPRSFSGGTNRALNLSLSSNLSDPNGDIVSVRVTSLPTNGVLYQYTTNGPGARIDAPNALLEDNAHLIFMPQPNADGSPYDSFTLVANDGELDSAPATFSISIVPPPLIQTTTVLKGPRPTCVLTFTGLSNVSYSVWGSATMDSWTYLGSATRTSLNQFSYTDYTITNAAVRFYRVRSL